MDAPSHNNSASFGGIPFEICMLRTECCVGGIHTQHVGSYTPADEALVVLGDTNLIGDVASVDGGAIETEHPENIYLNCTPDWRYSLEIEKIHETYLRLKKQRSCIHRRKGRVHLGRGVKWQLAKLSLRRVIRVPSRDFIGLCLMPM